VDEHTIVLQKFSFESSCADAKSIVHKKEFHLERHGIDVKAALPVTVEEYKKIFDSFWSAICGDHKKMCNVAGEGETYVGYERVHAEPVERKEREDGDKEDGNALFKFTFTAYTAFVPSTE